MTNGGEGVRPKITNDNDRGGVRKEKSFIVIYETPIMERECLVNILIMHERHFHFHSVVVGRM